jgi:hypothetical protein
MFWVGASPTSVIYINGTNEEDDGGVSLYAGDATAINEAYVGRAHSEWPDLT